MATNYTDYLVVDPVHRVGESSSSWPSILIRSFCPLLYKPTAGQRQAVGVCLVFKGVLNSEVGIYVQKWLWKIFKYTISKYLLWSAYNNQHDYVQATV